MEMEPVVICCAIITAIVCLLTIVLIKIAYKKKKRLHIIENRAQRVPVIVGGRRQATVRRRNVAGEQREHAETAYRGGDDSDEEADTGPAMFDIDDVAKMGKKKAAKLQAKAEKRSQREAELEDREERRQREAQKAQQRKEKEDEERQTELEREEAERRAKEEKEQREYEEYLQLKQAFSVENEGFDVDETADAENMLKDFVDFVKKTKVVSTDELANRWKLRPQDAVDRIKTLVADGTLTGVVDDRGKFIYITAEELKSVAKFINQRGRVSVVELVDYSNQLINLEPDSSIAAES